MSAARSTTNAQLFIPYVRDALNGQDTAEFVAKTIEIAIQAPGSVYRVDLKPTKDGRANMAFVHFHTIPETMAATYLFEKIQSGVETRLFYSSKWYWKIVEYKKTESNAPFTPRLEFNEAAAEQAPAVSPTTSDDEGDITLTECKVWLKGNKIVSEDGFETPVSPQMAKKMCAWLNDRNSSAEGVGWCCKDEAFKIARDRVMQTKPVGQVHGGECAESQG